MNVYYAKSSGVKARIHIIRDVQAAFPAGRGRLNIRKADGSLDMVKNVLWIKND